MKNQVISLSNSTNYLRRNSPQTLLKNWTQKNICKLILIKVNEISIMLIPKTKTQQENYRHIWVFAKCLNKTPANWMIFTMTKLGFTPGRQGWFNRQKSIDEMHHINGRTETMWPSQLMEKKFDKTQNHFM